MQTFLPYPSFTQSAACLDDKRLGKQRVECKRILLALQAKEYTCKWCGATADSNQHTRDEFCCSWKSIDTRHKWIKTPWKNHPAVKMWKGYEEWLCTYAAAICKEWIKRGYQDSLLPFFKEQLKNYPNTIDPDWIYEDKVSASHRSNLLRKDPVHYGKFGWKESNDLPYIWPVA